MGPHQAVDIVANGNRDPSAKSYILTGERLKTDIFMISRFTFGRRRPKLRNSLFTTWQKVGSVLRLDFILVNRCQGIL